MYQHKSISITTTASFEINEQKATVTFILIKQKKNITKHFEMKINKKKGRKIKLNNKKSL